MRNRRTPLKWSVVVAIGLMLLAMVLYTMSIEESQPELIPETLDAVQHGVPTE